MPHSWWSSVRRVLRLDAKSFPLGLGQLYKLVFPGDADFALRAHEAGVDVQITVCLIGEYFARSKQQLVYWRIDKFFTRFTQEDDLLSVASEAAGLGDTGDDLEEEFEVPYGFVMGAYLSDSDDESEDDLDSEDAGDHEMYID